jgi:hypothetical protein
MILLIPGLIGALAFECACKHNIKYGYRFISAALIFDLLALIINLLWLRFLKLITDFDCLVKYFKCLSFTPKFAILNIILCIILGLLFGLICKCIHKKHHIFIEESKE